MSTRSRSLYFLIPLTLAVLVAACGSADPTASPAPSGAPTASAPASDATGTQTDTEWGRIWDDVPPGFPQFPGSRVADDTSPDPVSATFAVARDDTAEIAAWLQRALESARFSTESQSGPLEDGGFVLDSVGDGECRLQVRVTPMGGMTFVIVRYGAACPMG